MFWIIFFILIIVAGLSYMAGSKENYIRTQNDKANPFRELLGPSDDKREGL